MPVTVIQGQEQAAGHALLGVTRPDLPDTTGLSLRIVGMQNGGEVHLDPAQGEGAAWSPVETWFPVDATSSAQSGLLIELGPSATWHLKPYQPYMLGLRFADGTVIDERMTWNAVRLPSNPPPVMATPPAPEPEPASVAPEVPEQNPLDAFAEMEEAAPAQAPATAEPEKSRPIWLWIIGFVLIWGILGAAVWFFVLQEPETQLTEGQTEPDPAPVTETQIPDVATPSDAGPPLTVEGARAFIRDQKPDAAASLTEARRFADAGQHQAAFLLYKHAARGGSADAAFQMGRYYDPAHFDAGTGVISRAEPQIAADWYEQAARAGQVAAMTRLGEMLRSGEVNPPDAPEQAVFWLQKAAEAGNSEAEKLLEK